MTNVGFGAWVEKIEVEIDAGKGADKVILVRIREDITFGLGVGNNDGFQEVVELFFGYSATIGVDNFTFDKVEPLGVAESQIVRIADESFVPIVEELDTTDNLRTDFFEALNQFGEFAGIGEFEETADSGKGCVDGSASDEV